MEKKAISDLFEAVKNAVESERLAGIEEICFSATGKTRDKSPKQAGRGKAARGVTLGGLKKIILDCRRCPLAHTRTNAVPGEGNPHAKLMFIGEAPGFDEDKQGRPFVGRAGQLLTKIVESIGLKRKDVYIANILKCRPPGNRDPMPSEIASCTPYLIKQIELIKPKVICALGKFAAQTLLNTDKPISRLRGNFYDYRGIKLMPTYHPAYLLRNPGGKKEVWEDMKKVAKELGLKIPARRKK